VVVLNKNESLVNFIRVRKERHPISVVS